MANDARRRARSRGDRIVSAHCAPPPLGHARFVLARALWASGRDRARARLETEQAGPSAAENLAEIRAWRQKHPG